MSTDKTMEPKVIVHMQGIVKRFPGVVANDQVEFSLNQGEVHALLGENGAGKSTLMNILAGLYRPDSGTITINGKQMVFSSPQDAIKAGIGMIHQHFMLVPSQTVTENILLGLKDPPFIINQKKYEEKIMQLGERLGLIVDPRAKVWQLTVGEQQRVEILKMLYRGTNVLIMDEPTAVLAPSEIEDLFITLRKMTSEGKSIVFISHKLNEVTEISNTISVLRRGKVTASGIITRETTKEKLAELMVGREVLFRIDKKPVKPGDVVLSVENVQADNDKNLSSLRGLNLNVRAGEIVGLAGVAGNGQSELAEVITGMRKCTKGKIFIQGQDVTNQSVLSGIHQGVSHIPEDRTHVGSAPNLSVTDNVIMKNYNQQPIGMGWLINSIAANKFATKLKDEYEISAPFIKTPVRLLSGGNLQRVILAREISSKPKLMIAVQPTRGLDVGAIEGVQRLLMKQREAGAAVLLISEELEELLSLSDRIYIIYEGQIMGEVTDGDIRKIGMMMTGTPLEEIGKETTEAHGK
ncbi:MAG: ABC transporter ATP-binding protein [Chloroflexi bacterium]|nr:ABC transporter ATP-binding protein [Chloroflexota bacterium]